MPTNWLGRSHRFSGIRRILRPARGRPRTWGSAPQIAELHPNTPRQSTAALKGRPYIAHAGSGLGRIRGWRRKSPPLRDGAMFLVSYGDILVSPVQDDIGDFKIVRA